MPIRFYTTEEVAGTLSEITLTTILTSTPDAPLHLLGFFATEYTAVENDDARIYLWLQREQIVDISIQHLVSAFDTSARCEQPFVPVDLVIPPGQSVKIGHLSGGTASDIVYTVVYNITGRG